MRFQRKVSRVIALSYIDQCSMYFCSLFCSYAGTIVGIEDLNAMCWPKSLWRSLRVNWDEMTNHEQRNRISPWEIELSINPQAPANNSCSPAPKNKRPRPSIPSDSGEISQFHVRPKFFDIIFACRVSKSHLICII